MSNPEYGKGDSNRTSDRERYRSEHDRIFGQGRVGRPARPGPLVGALNHDETCMCSFCMPTENPKFPRRTD